MCLPHHFGGRIAATLVLCLALGGGANAAEPDLWVDGWAIRQLTANSVTDSKPRVSGSNVAWLGQALGQTATRDQVFFYDGTATRQLTFNDYSSTDPDISGSSVVWEYYDGTSSSVYLYHGGTSQKLALSLIHISEPTRPY